MNTLILSRLADLTGGKWKTWSAPYLSSVWLSTLTKTEEVEMVPMEEPSKKDGLAGTRSGRRYDPNTAEENTFRHVSNTCTSYVRLFFSKSLLIEPEHFYWWKGPLNWTETDSCP